MRNLPGPGSPTAAGFRRKHRRGLHLFVLALVCLPILFAALSTGQLEFNTKVASSSADEASVSGVATAVTGQDDALHPSLLPLTVVMDQSKETSADTLMQPSGPATPPPLVFQSSGIPVERPTEAADVAAATAEPTPAPPPPVYIIYTVQDGDTVVGLAARYGIAAASIMWSNPGLESADSLALGDLLRVPMSDGIIYDVRPGDTLSDIANRFAMDVQAIIGFPGNNLNNADSLIENQTIFIPGGAVPEPVATPTPTPQPTEAPTAVPLPVPSPDDESPSDVGARAAELARSRIGAPYVSGAAGPDGFDCSGLVFWVYSQLGIGVGRSAPQQYASTRHVESSELQPGDIVFFENTFPSSQRITHVGIYVGGGGVVMAVDNGDVVREVSLAEAYWSDHFAGASRP